MLVALTHGFFKHKGGSWVMMSKKGLSSQSQLCFLYICFSGMEFPGLLSPDQVSVVTWGCHYLHLVMGSKPKKGIAKILYQSVENQASQACTVLSTTACLCRYMTAIPSH